MSSKKDAKAKKEAEEEVWVPPPYPEPAFKDQDFLDNIENICAGWVDDEPEGILAKKKVLQAILDSTAPNDLVSRHFYLLNKAWVRWETSKHQVLNSNILMLGMRASRLLAGVIKN